MTCSTLFAAPKIKLKISNAAWSNTSAWDLNRLPQINDTVFIPAGNTVIIDDNQTIGGSIIVVVYGVLELQGSGKLLLGNGSEIFVQVGGIITGSSNAQQIKIDNQHKFKGDEAPIVPSALGGPRLASSTTIGFDALPAGSGYGTFGILPVKFINFSIAKKNAGVQVYWTVATELQGSRFEIERSIDNRSWSIAAVIPANGNGLNSADYSYTDAPVAKGTLYYRIKQVDLNGQFAYTPAKSIGLSQQPDIKIWSASDKLMIKFSQELDDAVNVKVMSMSGQVLVSRTMTAPFAQFTIDKAGAQGYCVVILTDTKDLKMTRKVAIE